MRAILIIFGIALAQTCGAHSGGLDRYGGHWGPNGYHYHNGGGDFMQRYTQPRYNWYPVNRVVTAYAPATTVWDWEAIQQAAEKNDEWGRANDAKVAELQKSVERQNAYIAWLQTKTNSAFASNELRRLLGTNNVAIEVPQLLSMPPATNGNKTPIILLEKPE